MTQAYYNHRQIMKCSNASMLVWFSDYIGLAKHSTEVRIRYTYVFFMLCRLKKNKLSR